MLKKFFPLICILLIGLFFRMFQFQAWYQFGHDNDLSAWIMRDLVFNGHIRLIGQLTSAPGVFIGSLFYYLLVPLYQLTHYDPIGTVAYSWIVGMLAIFSFYFVLAKTYGKRAGIIGSFLYAASWGISLTEREVVPTTPIFLWSIWFFYCLHLLYKAKPAGLYLAAILFGLVWHIQLNLAVLSLLAAGIIVLRLRAFTFKHLLGSIVIFIITLSPFLLFELRHSFSQTRSLLGSTEAKVAVTRTPIEKVVHVMEYAAKNANYIIWERPETISIYLVPGLCLVLMGIVVIGRRLHWFTALSILGWLVLLVGFFVFHPINLSEYYINGANIIWLVCLAIALANIPRKASILVMCGLSVFLLENIYRLSLFYPNHTGYDQKKAIIASIKADAEAHNFPCVSYSFITDRGYELGYRYLTWVAGLKTAKISTEVPVYSIVFPLARVDHVDKTFGSIGLIYPTYSKYTSSNIQAACTGPDYNTSDTMFGYTD